MDKTGPALRGLFEGFPNLQGVLDVVVFNYIWLVILLLKLSELNKVYLFFEPYKYYKDM